MKGRRYRVINIASGWGRERVFCENGRQRVISFPIGFTDYPDPQRLPQDLHGRAELRALDLLELADVVEAITKGSEGV